MRTRLVGSRLGIRVGLMLGPSFTWEGESKLNLEFQLGSLLNCQIPSEIENLIIGVNLIAVAALLYLTRNSSRKVPLEAEAGD